MKILITTDLEGVAGVMNFEDWCTPGTRYYELAKEFLTLEVNAAAEGFFEGGATRRSRWPTAMARARSPRNSWIAGWS